MGGIGYVRMEEVPGIPTLPKTPGAVVYAPLGDTPLDPDVVLVAGRPGRLMLLLEAAGRAGVATQPGLLGRPTCMALPAALAGGTIASTACIGNRVYTDLGDDELYVTVPGRDLRAHRRRAGHDRQRQRHARRLPPRPPPHPRHLIDVGGPDMAPHTPRVARSSPAEPGRSSIAWSICAATPR